MSSPLAILLAAAGTVDVDVSQSNITLLTGETLKISDVWPSRSTLIDLECRTVLPRVCATVYRDLSTFSGQFSEIAVATGQPFPWNPSSLYIVRPPYLEMLPGMCLIRLLPVLLLLDDYWLIF